MASDCGHCAQWSRYSASGRSPGNEGLRACRLQCRSWSNFTDAGPGPGVRLPGPAEVVKGATGTGRLSVSLCHLSGPQSLARLSLALAGRAQGYGGRTVTGPCPAAGAGPGPRPGRPGPGEVGGWGGQGLVWAGSRSGVHWVQEGRLSAGLSLLLAGTLTVTSTWPGPPPVCRKMPIMRQDRDKSGVCARRR